MHQLLHPLLRNPIIPLLDVDELMDLRHVLDAQLLKSLDGIAVLRELVTRLIVVV